MATKPVPIQMEAEAHHDLRLMSAAAGKSMGELIWLMLKSLRNRLEEYHGISRVRMAYTIKDADIINLIFRRDLREITGEEFDREIRSIFAEREVPEGEPKKPRPGKPVKKIRPGGGEKIVKRLGVTDEGKRAGEEPIRRGNS
jgi:hypothetical protein